MIFSYLLIIIKIKHKAPCYLVLVYLARAFDTLDHNSLSIGLNDIDIHSQVHSWFSILFHLEHLW